MIFDDEDYDPARRLQALTEAEQDDAFLWQAYLSVAAQTHLASQSYSRPRLHGWDTGAASPQHMPGGTCGNGCAGVCPSWAR